MRQAGRYLPEYRAIRENRRQRPRSLLHAEACRRGDAAADPALRLRCGDPVLRHPGDSACARPDACAFAAGEGPRLDPLDDPGRDRCAARSGRSTACLRRSTKPCGWSRPRCRANVTLLGFCGAPWTVATYMVAGRGTPDQAPARLFAYRHPEAFARLIDMLVEASVDYLVAPVRGRRRCGADLRHLGGRAAAGRVRALVHRADAADRRPVRRRGAGAQDHRISARRRQQLLALCRGRAGRCGRPRLDDRSRHSRAMHPAAVAGAGQSRSAGAARRRRGARPRVDAILAALAGGPFIFNLGHGILPDTPIAHVEQMLKRVRR